MQAQAVQQKQITPSHSLHATQNLLAALVSELCFARNIFRDEKGALERFPETQLASGAPKRFSLMQS